MEESEKYELSWKSSKNTVQPNYKLLDSCASRILIIIRTPREWVWKYVWNDLEAHFPCSIRWVCQTIGSPRNTAQGGSEEFGDFGRDGPAKRSFPQQQKWRFTNSYCYPKAWVFPLIITYNKLDDEHGVAPWLRKPPHNCKWKDLEEWFRMIQILQWATEASMLAFACPFDTGFPPILHVNTVNACE